MDTLEMREVEAAIEGILFASGEPVHVERICVAMNMDRATVPRRHHGKGGGVSGDASYARVL